MRLETDRLILRPMEPTDVEALFAFLGTAENMSFYPRPWTREEIVYLIEKHGTLARESGLGWSAIVLRESGAVIGDCGITFQNIDGEDCHEIGYHLRRDQWGKGYATEAAQAAKRFGFEKLKLPKLYSYMAEDHLASRKVAERNGMKKEKTFNNPQNRDLPTAVYGISREEYEATT